MPMPLQERANGKTAPCSHRDRSETQGAGNSKDPSFVALLRSRLKKTRSKLLKITAPGLPSMRGPRRLIERMLNMRILQLPMRQAPKIPKRNQQPLRAIVYQSEVF